MHYIYCYTNKINGKKYVGQTNHLRRRQREHESTAFNPASSSYNHLFHKKLREYGIENFEFELLEQIYTDDLEVVNEREQYWISYYDTYCGNGKGYNMDKGGGQKARSSVLTPEELQEVKTKIKNGVAYFDIQNEYNISASFISAINHGDYFFDPEEKYPLRKFYKEDSDYDELIDLLINTEMPMSEIADHLEIGYSTVKKINYGTLRKGLYPTYPIRKKSGNALRADKIKNLLLNTEYSISEIAILTNSSDETVRRVNKGETFREETLTYPLREPVTTIS